MKFVVTEGFDTLCTVIIPRTDLLLKCYYAWIGSRTVCVYTELTAFHRGQTKTDSTFCRLTISHDLKLHFDYKFRFSKFSFVLVIYTFLYEEIFTFSAHLTDSL